MKKLLIISFFLSFSLLTFSQKNFAKVDLKTLEIILLTLDFDNDGKLLLLAFGRHGANLVSKN